MQADRCCLNHFEGESVLTTKHGLYWSLKAYFDSKGEKIPDWLPQTFHVVPSDGGGGGGEDDDDEGDADEDEDPEGGDGGGDGGRSSTGRRAAACGETPAPRPSR